MKRLTILFVLVMCVTLSQAQMATFQPLGSGWSWTYESTGGNVRTIMVEGLFTIHGKETVSLRWEETSPPQIYHNCWTTDRDGNMILHGAWNEDGLFEMSYKPGFLMLPAVDSSTRCWTTSSEIFFGFDNTNSNGMSEFENCILDQQLQLVPVGLFDVFAIGETDDPTRTTSYDTFGRRIDAGSRIVGYDRWYAPGIGLVKDGGLELISYTGPTTNESSSWGAVKNLYR